MILVIVTLLIIFGIAMVDYHFGPAIRGGLKRQWDRVVSIYVEASRLYALFMVKKNLPRTELEVLVEAFGKQQIKIVLTEMVKAYQGGVKTKAGLAELVNAYIEELRDKAELERLNAEALRVQREKAQKELYAKREEELKNRNLEFANDDRISEALTGKRMHTQAEREYMEAEIRRGLETKVVKAQRQEQAVAEAFDHLDSLPKVVKSKLRGRAGFAAGSGGVGDD